jgi:hypothetical protein
MDENPVAKGAHLLPMAKSERPGTTSDLLRLRDDKHAD